MHDVLWESFVDIRKSAGNEMHFGTACAIEYQLERWDSQGSINMPTNHGSSFIENRTVLDFVEKRTHDDGTHLI